MSFQLEYLDKYEIKFEMNLGYESETPCGNWTFKTTRDKNPHVTFPLKEKLHEILGYVFYMAGLI
jgi:hypothetical protein